MYVCMYLSLSIYILYIYMYVYIHKLRHHILFYTHNRAYQAVGSFELS